MKPDFDAREAWPPLPRCRHGSHEKAIFDLNFMYFCSKYISFGTLKVFTGVSNGAELIHDGFRSYKVECRVLNLIRVS